MTHIHRWWLHPAHIQVVEGKIRGLCLRCWCWREFPRLEDKDWAGRLKVK